MQRRTKELKQDGWIWAARLLIGLVLFFNVQCALAFLISPGAYSPGFELSGPIGDSMVRGMGVLFLMWNVPYAVAVRHPVLQRVSLYEAVIMQIIGFTGEALILAFLPAGHTQARETIGRFLLFDGAGMVMLMCAALIAIRRK